MRVSWKSLGISIRLPSPSTIPRILEGGSQAWHQMKKVWGVGVTFRRRKKMEGYAKIFQMFKRDLGKRKGVTLDTIKDRNHSLVLTSS